MTGLAVILGIVCVGGLVVRSSLVQRRRWHRTLAEVADRWGLEVVPGSFTRSFSAVGAPKGVPLSLGSAGHRSGTLTQANVEVHAEPALPPGTRILARVLRHDLARALGDEQLTIGDPQFDAEVLINGPEVALRARLDADTRARLFLALRNDITVTSGGVRWRSPSRRHDADALNTVVERILGITVPLVEGGDDRARLEAIIREDPAPGVREGAFAALLRAFPAGESTELLRDLAREGPPTLRMRAARALSRDEAISTARAILTAPAPADPVAEALECLLDLDVRLELPAVEALVDWPEAAARVQIVRGLERLADAASQELLIQLLDDAEAPVATAAATALGEVGTIESIGPLNAAAGRAGVRGAAEAAIEAIQARVDPAHRGGLALAREATGGLALEGEDS